MKTVEKLDIFMYGKKVGTLAPYERFRTAFEYSEEWLTNGFSISPFSLPLTPGVKISKIEPFEGLFGIFADSLPDGWGKLLVDRMLRKNGEDPESIGTLSRLSIVGASGMGALEYRPAAEYAKSNLSGDLDRLALECKKILESKDSDDLDVLFSLGGSSGGARPKVMMNIDGDEWIVKFPAHDDPEHIGQMEYDYNLCAKECGMQVPDFRLLPSNRCAGYFAVKRFDRLQTPKGVERVHMASASALLEVSHRVPALDYNTLMSLTWQLTKKADEMLRMYKLMCFNVFAHNRDDHSNNFSYLCEAGTWHLAPAYDLTYSNSIGGEHATTVAGEGKNPTIDHLLVVAAKAGIKESTAKEIAQSVQETVQAKLGKYL